MARGEVEGNMALVADEHMLAVLDQGWVHSPLGCRGQDRRNAPARKHSAALQDHIPGEAAGTGCSLGNNARCQADRVLEDKVPEGILAGAASRIHLR